jgi:hypothetical protein
MHHGGEFNRVCILAVQLLDCPCKGNCVLHAHVHDVVIGGRSLAAAAAGGVLIASRQDSGVPVH